MPTKKKSTVTTGDVVTKIMQDQQVLHGTRKRKQTEAATSSLPKIPRKKTPKKVNTPKPTRPVHAMSPSTSDDEVATDSDDDDGVENIDFASSLLGLIPDTDVTDPGVIDDTLVTNLAQEDPDMVALLNECFETLNECGPDVSPSLVAKIQSQLTKFAEPDDIKAMAANLRPQNLPLLVVPQLNAELFPKILNHRVTNIVEFGLQKCQKMVVQSMMPIIQIMDDIIKGKFIKKDIMVKCGDALKMQAFASTALTYRRRLNIKPRMQHTYTRELVSRANPPSKFLFGDDLHKKVTELKATECIAKDFSKSFNNRRQKGKQNQKQGQGYSQGQGQDQNQNQYQKTNQSKNGQRGGYKGKKPWNSGKKSDKTSQ